MRGARAPARARPGRDPGGEPLPALGEEESGEDEHQVQRLCVHGLQEEAHREDGEVEDGLTGSLRAELVLRDPVEKIERDEAARERDEDAREHVVTEQRVAEDRDSRRVQGKKAGAPTAKSYPCSAMPMYHSLSERAQTSVT